MSNEVIIKEEDLVGIEAPGGLAWMGGFSDGEGSISLGSYGKRQRFHSYLAIFVANTVIESLLVFYKLYGGTVYSRTRARERPGGPTRPNRPTYTWHCPMENSEKFLRDILPYLLIKRRKAELALKWLELQSRRKKWSRWTKEERQEESEIVSEFDKLRTRVLRRSSENRSRPKPNTTLIRTL